MSDECPRFWPGSRPEADAPCLARRGDGGGRGVTGTPRDRPRPGCRAPDHATGPGRLLRRAIGIPGVLLRGRWPTAAGPRDRLEPPGHLRPEDRDAADRPIADLLSPG